MGSSWSTFRLMSINHNENGILMIENLLKLRIQYLIVSCMACAMMVKISNRFTLQLRTDVTDHKFSLHIRKDCDVYRGFIQFIKRINDWIACTFFLYYRLKSNTSEL